MYDCLMLLAVLVLKLVYCQSPLDIYVTRGYDAKYANNGQVKRTTCKYVNKNNGNSIKVTYCPKSSNCVAIRVYKKGQRGWIPEEERMGCQTKKHNILKRLCSPKVCYLTSLSLTEEKDKMYRYCCCTGDGCNTFVLNDNEFEKTQATTISPKPTKHSTVLLTVIISSVSVLHLIILCLAVAYISNKIHKRRRSNQGVDPLMMMRTQNLAAISPEAMSEETLNDILRGNLIHQGAMSAIRLATYKDQEVAVKVYQPCSKGRWVNEKEIYETLGEHPNIAKFITSDQYPQDFGFEGIIVMTHYSQGPLLNYLRNNTLSWDYMIRLAFCITNGLSYLHRETNSEGSSDISIAHRDLTSRNVLVKTDGTCVLADFGYALRLEGKHLNGKFPLVGCPRYMAPEVLNGSMLHRDWAASFKQADCYGLGLLFWELSRRCHDIVTSADQVPECLLPFEEELGSGPCLKEVLTHVCVNEQRPKFPQQWLKKNQSLDLLKETIAGCWDQEGDARLTSSCVLNRLKQMGGDAMKVVPPQKPQPPPIEHYSVEIVDDYQQQEDCQDFHQYVKTPLIPNTEYT